MASRYTVSIINILIIIPSICNSNSNYVCRCRNHLLYCAHWQVLLIRVLFRAVGGGGHFSPLADYKHLHVYTLTHVRMPLLQMAVTIAIPFAIFHPLTLL